MNDPNIDVGPDSEFLVLREAARLIGRSVDPEASIYGILRLLSQLLGLNRGRVALADKHNGLLRIHYAYGLTEEEKARGVYRLDEGVTGKVYKTGQVALVQDIDNEPIYLTRAIRREVLPNETVSYIAVPILRDESPIGVLAVHRIRGRQRPFERDIALLQVIATFINQILRINDLIAEHTAQLRIENEYLKGVLESRGSAYGILGESAALQHAIRQSQRVANTNTTAMLQGESGTGKEKFARMLHLASNRRDEPFITINCAAIPETLMEAELFGYEKGAFTGASQMKKGKIEMASGGTLFLDEIGDLNLELQAKLLRVLEQQIIQRVGSVKDLPVDVRIVAATHKNLQSSVNNGQFRLDLFYRLNVFPIRLPALRERGGDISILARHFLNMANQEFHRGERFGNGVLEHLERYEWPGNIRQLENVIKRVVLLSTHGVINRELVEEVLHDESSINSLGEPAANSATRPDPSTVYGLTAGLRPGPAQAHQQIPGNALDGMRSYSWVNENERGAILQALQHCGGNKTRAAISMGMTPRQLRYRLKKLGIEQAR
ncbi:MAG: sigma 54-interacting transcriptional regulator [Thiohalomonadaceae bacterium]